MITETGQEVQPRLGPHREYLRIFLTASNTPCLFVFRLPKTSQALELIGLVTALMMNNLLLILDLEPWVTFLTATASQNTIEKRKSTIESKALN